MKKIVTMFLSFILSLAMLLPMGCKKFDVSVSGTEKESPSVSSTEDSEKEKSSTAGDISADTTGNGSENESSSDTSEISSDNTSDGDNSSENDSSDSGTANEDSSNTEETENRFYTLSEIYESGEISRQELLSIIYYRNDGIPDFNEEQYPEDFVPTPKDPEELDESIVQEIANAYTEQLLKEDAELYAGVEVILRYYGTYRDYICIGMILLIPDVAFGDMSWKETIDGLSYWVTADFIVIIYKK